jgi:hypothetical protein
MQKSKPDSKLLIINKYAQILIQKNRCNPKNPIDNSSISL